MALTISSLQNSRIKDLAKLAKHSERDRRRITVVEGERECGHALAAGVVPLEAYVCQELLNDEGHALFAQLERFDAKRQTMLLLVTPDIFAKIAYRGESGGILLVIPYVTRSLADFEPRTPAFIAVIEGAEKPGNLGAILRSADSAGVDAVIVTDGATDTHNPNVIRASLGAIFTVPIIEAPVGETIDFLQKRHIQVVAATPEASNLYTDVDYSGPTAIVMGSEAHGLSDTWRAPNNRLVKIPMFGKMDSLNLATSTALLLYEVVRQRHSSR